MSYLRGAYYIWSSHTHAHFWALDGDDGWDESVWASGIIERSRDKANAPSGVALPQGIADEYAVMRFAELIVERALHSTVNRALESGGGNGGCLALQQLADSIRLAFPIEAIQSPPSQGTPL